MLLEPPLLFPFNRPIRRGFSPFRRSSSVIEVPTYTNAQKLSLPANTAVGTQVKVSDGFVVSGTGDPTVDGFWISDGTTVNDKPSYRRVGSSDPEDWCQWNSDNPPSVWFFNISGIQSTDDVAYPWLIANWSFGTFAIITHPAVQQLQSPSSAQGGVFVSGGTQDGVYANNLDYAEGETGRMGYVLLGSSAAIQWFPADGSLNTVFGSGPTAGAWGIEDGIGRFSYYSLSDVATPDLASNWKNASDDSPASITVTSVTQGEIYAGLAITNDGITNGSSYVSQPFHGRQYYMGLNGGGSNNMHWDTDFNVWTDDVGVWTTDNVAFPYQGTDNGGGHTGATFSRNNVAAEANWSNL